MSLDIPPSTGGNRAFLQGSLDIPSRGAVEPGKIVVCAGVFLLAVGEKADLSKNIAMCGNMCH